MKDTLHIAELISRKIRGVITSEEWLELESWITENPDNQVVYNRAIDKKHQLDKLEIYTLFNKERVRAKLEDELFPTKSIDFSAKRIMRYAAAILLPIILIGGAYLFLKDPTTTNFTELNGVIQPGTQKAILVLSNGEEVSLEGDNAEKIIADGKRNIKNENKILDYFIKEAEDKVEELRYNELKTPLGGSYKLQLADGTKVWLNAGSSLRFPVAFTTGSRDVYLQGEGYFEVVKTGSPFNVYADKMNVSVLGTSFNVSAYSEDTEFKTTLVEGKVRVGIMNDGNVIPNTILSPNDQAVLDVTSKTWKTEQVNTTYFTSWIDGKIEFNNEDLDEVMKRLARWYNFEYIFENELAKEYHYTARLSSDENISDIIEMLELTTDVKFIYRDGKIVIL